MARSTEITFARVAATADAMHASGVEPTVKGLLTKLGGSASTVLPYLQLWKSQSGPAPAIKVAAALTPEVAASLEAWANGTLALAQKNHDVVLSAERAARVAAEESADQRGAELESARASMKELEQSLRQRDDQLITTQSELNRLTSVLTAQERERAKLQGAIEAAHRDAVAAQHRAELAEQRVLLIEEMGPTAQQRSDVAGGRGVNAKATPPTS